MKREKEEKKVNVSHTNKQTRSERKKIDYDVRYVTSSIRIYNANIINKSYGNHNPANANTNNNNNDGNDSVDFAGKKSLQYCETRKKMILIGLVVIL